MRGRGPGRVGDRLRLDKGKVCVTLSPVQVGGLGGSPSPPALAASPGAGVAGRIGVQTCSDMFRRVEDPGRGVG